MDHFVWCEEGLPAWAQLRWVRLCLHVRPQGAVSKRKQGLIDRSQPLIQVTFRAILPPTLPSIVIGIDVLSTLIHFASNDIRTQKPQPSSDNFPLSYTLLYDPVVCYISREDSASKQITDEKFIEQIMHANTWQKAFVDTARMLQSVLAYLRVPHKKRRQILATLFSPANKGCYTRSKSGRRTDTQYHCHLSQEVHLHEFETGDN
ncbi:hypothetical protein BaRGS_00036509 [Batillaria attramentaria]|uniref:Uncharacterized protein n=1 Tax=Batillaria attramentaria TaxID=370345 RepID=A0ABD0JBS3_9CAEN